jgi:hypothetical protein
MGAKNVAALSSANSVPDRLSGYNQRDGHELCGTLERRCDLRLVILPRSREKMYRHSGLNEFNDLDGIAGYPLFRPLI